MKDFMYTPVLAKNDKKTKSNSAKMTFNRLRRKIEGLQRKIKDVEEDYEKALCLYHSDLISKEKQLADLITEFLLKIKELTRDPKVLNKKERATLKVLLQDDLDILMEIVFFTDLHDEVKVIYKEIYEKSVEESFNEEIVDLKNELCEHGIFNEEDFANFESPDSWQDLFMNFGQTLGKKMQEAEEATSNKSKPKTKKQLLKEEKARQIEEWQNKGMGSIYKRLVKELHPDLEQDQTRRVEKDSLMKRLTTAYEQRDLITLLDLESEWLGHLDKEVETSSDERLKLYNSLLKDQIGDLEIQLKLVCVNPRFYDMQRFMEEDSESPIENIKRAILECNEIIDLYLIRLKDLSGNSPIKILKKRLGECDDMLNSMPSEEDKIMELLNMLIGR